MTPVVQREPTLAIIRLAGPRLDSATGPGLKRAMQDLAMEGTTRLLLDFAAVDFIDSAGLGALISGYKAFQPDGQLVLFDVCGKVGAVFRLTRLDRVFVTAKEESAARAALT